MTPVFLDTVGLLVLWDHDDQWHLAAQEVFDRLRSERRPLVTTTFVLLECGNAAARRTYRLAVDRLWTNLIAVGGLVEPTAADLAEARAAYRRGNVDSPGMVDCVSFGVMRRMNLSEAFTNDRHFRAAGFSPLF
jgi:uncharacterized protein